MHVAVGTVLVLVCEEDSQKVNEKNGQVFPIQSIYSTSVSSAELVSKRPQTRSVYGTAEQKQLGEDILLKKTLAVLSLCFSAGLQNR